MGSRAEQRLPLVRQEGEGWQDLGSVGLEGWAGGGR